MNDSGILNTNIANGVTIGASSNLTYFVELNSILSGINLFRQSLGNSDLELEIEIKKSISLVDENEITLSYSFIYLNCVKISDNLVSNLLKSPSLDYKLIDWVQKSYVISDGVVSGNVYEVLLNSYNYVCSGMIIWINKVGDTLNNILKECAISEIVIKDQNNLLLTNTINYSTSFMDFMNHRYFFKNSSF